MNFWKRFIDWCQRPNMIEDRTFNPHVHWIRWSRGAKAGSISGVIFGALLGSILNIGYNVIYSILRGRLEYFLISLMNEGIMFLGPILVSILFGLIGGLIFGLMFVAFYDKLPGKTSQRKGIVTSIIFWFALLLGLPAVINLYRGGFEGLSVFVKYSLYLDQAVLSLAPVIFFGWLMGRFWTSETS